MGGIQRLFLRITPIIMLICFICLGITHAFQHESQTNITYLTTETITIDTNNTPNDTTDDTEIKNYSFDFKSYRENINSNIITRATTNAIDTDSYRDTLDSFNAIWSNGYQVGDVLRTIANAIILVINTLIVPLNILLVPLRITAGLFLTIFSLIGININNDTNIIKALKGILDNLIIPLIPPTTATEDTTEINNTTWQINNINNYYEIDLDFYVVWDENTIAKFSHISTKPGIMWYSNAGNNFQPDYIVYQNNTWNRSVIINGQEYNNLIFIEDAALTKPQARNAKEMLQTMGQQVNISMPEIVNNVEGTWIFQNDYINVNTLPNTQTYYVDIQYTNMNNQATTAEYIGFSNTQYYESINYGNITITEPVNGRPELIKFFRQQYKTLTITDASGLNTTQAQSLWQFLTDNAILQT